MTLVGINADELTGRKQAKRDGVDWQKATNRRKKKKQQKPKEDAEPVVTKDDMYIMFSNLNTLFKIDGSPSYEAAENCFIPPKKGDILAELVLGRDCRHDWECLVNAMVNRLEPDTDLENIMSWIINKSMDYIETTKGGKKFLIPKAADFYRIFDPYFKQQATHSDEHLLMISLALSTFLMYIFNTQTILLDVIKPTENVENLFKFVEALFDKAIDKSSEVLYRAVVFTLIWYQRYLRHHRGCPHIPFQQLHISNVRKAFDIAKKLCKKDTSPSIPSYSFNLDVDRKRKILACQIHVLGNLANMGLCKEEPSDLFTVPKPHQVACNLENWILGTHLGWTLYQLPYNFKENCLYYFEVYVLTGGSIKVGFMPHSSSSDYNGENPGELEGACLYDANEKTIWVHQRDQHQVISKYGTQKDGSIVGCLLNTFSQYNRKCPDTVKDPLRSRFYTVKFYLNGIPVEEVNPATKSQQMAFFDRPFSLTVALAAFQQTFVMLRPEQWQFAPICPIPLSFIDLNSKDKQLKCLLRPTINDIGSMFDSDDEDFHECVQLSDSDIENDETYANHSKVLNSIVPQKVQVPTKPTKQLGDCKDSQQITEVAKALELSVEFKKMPLQMWKVQKLIFIIKDEQDLDDFLKTGGKTKLGKFISTDPKHHDFNNMYKQPIFLNKSYQVNTKVEYYTHKKDKEQQIGPFYFRTVTDLAKKHKYERDRKEGNAGPVPPLFTFPCCVAGSLEKMIRTTNSNITYCKNSVTTENVQVNEEIVAESNEQSLMQSPSYYSPRPPSTIE